MHNQPDEVWWWWWWGGGRRGVVVGGGVPQQTWRPLTFAAFEAHISFACCSLPHWPSLGDQ